MISATTVTTHECPGTLNLCSSISPTQRMMKEFESEYGSFSGDDMFQNLKAFLAEHTNSGGTAKFLNT